jgi:lysophosphatidic acid acyltransferase/lysophosphatidylinositol acyltransferase
VIINNVFVDVILQIMHIYDEFKSSFIIIVFMGYIFLVSGLIINFLQLCSCIIWPFNKQLFRKINCYLALGIWSREYINWPESTDDGVFAFRIVGSS